MYDTHMTLMSLVLATALAPVKFDLAADVDSRITGCEPASALSRFVGYPGKAASDCFVINTNFWLRGIDFSCVSPWNSGGGVLRAGTAISKRHIVFAKHFPLWKGVRIVFVGEDGGVCPCRIEATKWITGTDIMVGLLDAELTPNIRPAKILPDDFRMWIGQGGGLPVITFNRKEQAMVNTLSYLPDASASSHIVMCAKPSDERRSRFREDIAVGDSGNPVFLLIGDEPVLLFCLYGVGIGGGNGFALHCYRREIQTAMDELCPGYKLECFDFSKVGNGK